MYMCMYVRMYIMCSYYSLLTIYHGNQQFFFSPSVNSAAQECFQRIDRKLRATLKRKHIPKVSPSFFCKLHYTVIVIRQKTISSTHVVCAHIMYAV